jgi:hypothetical protein
MRGPFLRQSSHQQPPLVRWFSNLGELQYHDIKVHKTKLLQTLLLGRFFDQLNKDSVLIHVESDLHEIKFSFQGIL